MTLLLSSMYVTEFSNISFNSTKLYGTLSFAIASSVTYSEIRQNFANSVQAIVARLGRHYMHNMLHSQLWQLTDLHVMCLMLRNKIQKTIIGY